MGLKDSSSSALTSSKEALDNFLGDEALLSRAQALLSSSSEESSDDEENRKVLACFVKTFSCYIIKDEAARALRTRLGELEAALATDRNSMQLGYILDGVFVKASSVQLRNLMRTSESHSMRKACFEGLRSIGPFVVDKFCEIVKLRNKLATLQGHVDYYDMKVSQAEGFNKVTLFSILDELEAKTRPIMEKSRAKLAEEKSAEALLPENTGFFLSGELAKAKDPYFPFEVGRFIGR